MTTQGRWPVRPEIVVVGSSTGGPAALKALLGPLPATFPLPVLIAQHMPADFTPLLAGSLDAHLPLEVAEAADGEPLRAGKVYVAPGGTHMTVSADRSIRIQQGGDTDAVHPSVDLLFASAVRVYGPAVLAVVLTGMGSDGLAGARAVADTGGAVLAQDEGSSVVWGMPGMVTAAGFASTVAPPERLGIELVQRAGWR